MQWVKFPNVDFTFPLKVKSVISECKTTDCADYYTINEIYNTLYNVKKYELGGEYSLKNGFVIDPRVTKYDIEQGRPYTSLNFNSKTGIVWHSHPFNDDGISYPSIEDLNVVRLHPQLMFLLLTRHGLYVMTSTKKYIDVDVVEFYKNMQPKSSNSNWNYEELETSFLKNKGYTKNMVHKYGLIVNLIPLSKINKLNEFIKKAYSYKKF